MAECVTILDKLEHKILFAWFTIFLFWGIGSYIMLADLRLVPTSTQLAQIDPEMHEAMQSATAFNAMQERRFFEFEMGNGYVSAIENYVMMLMLFFGFMRFVDLNKLWRMQEVECRWLWFWGNQNL